MSLDESKGNPPDPIEAARSQARKAKDRKTARGPTDPDQIGPFEIAARLGSGGMGVVYLGLHKDTEVTAAIKVLRPEVVSASASRRFAQEIEILKALDHPGIARVLDAGQASIAGRQRLYCALEYIAGQHIIRYADINGLSRERRLRLFLKACDAIAHAHSKGVLHRDLKPHNILVEMGGSLRVVDFGVARWTGEGRTTMHTEVGQILGTVQYMSPEQIQGVHDQLDERTDVYALGVVLFELITGELPYHADPKDPIAAVRAIRAGQASKPREVDETISPELERVMLCGMAHDPDERYGSVDDLRDDLNRVLDGQEPVGVVHKHHEGGSLVSKIVRLIRPQSGDAQRRE